MSVSSERNFNLQDIYYKESAAKCGLVRKTVTAVAKSSYHCGCDKTHFLFCFVLFLCIHLFMGGGRGHCAYCGKKIKENTEIVKEVQKSGIE